MSSVAAILGPVSFQSCPFTNAYASKTQCRRDGTRQGQWRDNRGLASMTFASPVVAPSDATGFTYAQCRPETETQHLPLPLMMQYPRLLQALDVQSECVNAGTRQHEAQDVAMSSKGGGRCGLVIS